ncbi:MAG: STAS domain-containing protein [Bryobacteraceae bacterium]|nr:STAS domain-containing protein [Bryobacterales bacterium]MEB2361384.1 STAS domain-containing protein [Bryobacterales bacterium]NUN03625.1 STAS domain-containing protein [Bryobacteraceae bacterium]
MSAKIDVRQSMGVSIVDVSGRITLGESSNLLRLTVKDLVAQQQRNIVLNLSGVSYIDSGGLGEIVGSYATVAHAGGRLKLLNPQRRVDDLLQVTKLLTVFEIYTDEAAAVRSFQQAVSA